MRVVIYLRLASPDRTGFEEQRERCLSYAAQGEHDVIAVYEDFGQSGMDNKRPGLQAMLEATKAGAFEGLIVDRLYRLSRNELADVIQRLKQRGISLIVTDGTPKASDEAVRQALAELFKSVGLKKTIRWYLGANPDAVRMSINELQSTLSAQGVRVGRTTVAEVLREVKKSQ